MNSASTTSSFEHPNHCLCQADAPFLCASCVKRGLHDAHQARRAALERHTHVVQTCTLRLSQLQDYDKLAELQEESKALRERLQELQRTTTDLALDVAHGAVIVEEKQERLRTFGSKAAQDRDKLHRLDQAFSSAMSEAIQSARQSAQLLRFQWALQAFELHRLDVVPVDAQDRVKVAQGRMKHARGIGKIGGLPLPHAGPELFGVLPPLELQSALRLVASLTSLVARCLGIILPHPILLRLGDDGQNDIITDKVLDSLDPSRKAKQQVEPSSSNNNLSSSTSSLASIIMGQSRSVLGFATRTKATTHQPPTLLEETSQNFAVPPSMDPSVVQRRIVHAQAAILAEDTKGTCYYSLSSDVMNQDEFAIALQLLQNDLIALCIRTGVPVDKLWPAEAVLLNLFELYEHCQAQASQSSASSVEEDESGK